jgi:hypothetical protein
LQQVDRGSSPCALMELMVETARRDHFIRNDTNSYRSAAVTESWMYNRVAASRRKSAAADHTE